MYIENHPLTGEEVNIYADNVPEVEGTALDVALPYRKQHFEVKKNDLFNNTLGRPKMKDILDPKNNNDVADVIVLKPVIKAEDGKIDVESDFLLFAERPTEEISEESKKVMFTSQEPEILEVGEDGSLKALVELGQTFVKCEWPSGIVREVLVTIGSVSEVKEPGIKEDVVNPEEEKSAMIKYALMSIADHMESVDKITVEDLTGLEYTEYLAEVMDKTKAPIEAGKMVVILIPSESGLKAMKDNGLGSQEEFSEKVFGANGQYSFELDGVKYNLYGELFTVGGEDSDFFIYIV